MTSRQSARPWDTQRWNLPGERSLDQRAVASRLPPGREVADLRGLALGIQLCRAETFFDNESSHFLRFVLLHRLQEPLVALTPILTLEAHIIPVNEDTGRRGQNNLHLN